MTFDQLSPEQQQRIRDEWYELPEVKGWILHCFADVESYEHRVSLPDNWHRFRDSAVARYEQTVTVPMDELIAVIKQIGSWQKPK